MDKSQIRRTRNLQLIPSAPNRRGGRVSYAEWAHVAGIFQSLIYLHSTKKQENHVLDVGCGTGLMAIASQPFLGDTGRYVGLDVSRAEIAFCKRHYPSPQFSFSALEVSNPEYNPSGGPNRPWDLQAESFDLVTAVSVWTHFNESDAFFWMKEVHRVLKPGAIAIISFFILDDLYKKTLSSRTGREGRFHTTSQDRWIFGQSAYGSKEWFSTTWARNPEAAIAVSEPGVDRLLSDSGLLMLENYPGNWKEFPGIYFQDVVVLQKK